MMNKFRKWWLLLAIALVPLSARADGLLSNKFSTAVAGTSIDNIGTAISFHKMTWNVSGTVTVCTVALDTSTDGITWSAGGAIAGQTCTSNGASTVANVTANYVRMNMTAFTATAGSSVTVTWTGGINAAGTGGITGTIASPQVAFASAGNTIAGDAQFTWDNTNKTLNAGPALASMVAPLQTYFSGDPRTEFVTAIGSGASSQGGIFSQVQTGGVNASYGWALYGVGYTAGNPSGFAAGVEGDTYVNIPLGQTSTDAQKAGSFFAANHSAGNITGGDASLSAVRAITAQDGTGSIDVVADFFADTGTNVGGGTIPINAGFYARQQTIGTLHSGFYSEDQGTGFSFYSKGGLNTFNASAGQTAPILDLVNAASGGANTGDDVVRGNGMVNSLAANFPTLRSTVQNSATTFAHVTTNLTAPLHSYFDEQMTDSGGYNMGLNNDNIGAGITFSETGLIEIFPGLSSSHTLLDYAIETPQYHASPSGDLLISSTSPSIAANGCGGSAASITIGTSTAAFTVNVGTSNTGTCTVTMPAAANNWACGATDITTTSTNVAITKSVPGGAPTTQITLQNYTDIMGTHAWVDSDKIQVRCTGE